MSFEEAARSAGAPLFRNWSGNGGSGGWQGQRSPDRPGARSDPESHGADQDRKALKKVPDGIWIQFPDADSYFAREKELLASIADSDGNDDVVIYLRNTRAIRLLPPNLRVNADAELERRLQDLFGRENVKIRQ